MKKSNTHVKQHRSLGLLLLIGLCSLVMLACGSESRDDADGTGRDGFNERELPNLSVSPSTVDFAQIAIGNEDRQTVRISNTGRGVLRMSITMEASREFHKGENWVGAAELNNGEFVDLTVIYRPEDTSPPSGHIAISSNDPDRQDVQIPLRTPSLTPTIFSPEVVQFSRVPAGGSDWQITEVHNIGQAALLIEDVILTGSADFEISFPVLQEGETVPAIENDINEWPTLLEPDESFPVRVKFSPETDDPSSAEMIFYSNDPMREEYKVTLSGNSGSPCIKITHEESGIDFVESAIGQVSNRTIGIENCSPTAALHVSAIEISDDGGGVFDLRVETLPGDLPAEEAIIPARETANFVVSYTPVDESVANGQLTVRSNDVAKPVVNIPIIGKGTNNVCPVAVAEGRVVGTNSYRDAITATPLSTVELTAEGSSDPDGSVARYQWSIITKPQNSNARLTPNNTVEKPRIWLDLAGSYEIELVVYDDGDLASCESSIVKIESIPGDEIHVQLVWDAPSVNNPQVGVGTDLDLHYLHPNGQWNQSPWDIYWLNTERDWGTPGNPSIATLDIDDLWGVNPENVSHSNPVSGLSYSVGVYYYSDNNFGPSYATIQIRVHGQLALEIRDKQLQSRGHFWNVGAIQWPSGQIIQRDELSWPSPPFN